MSLITIAALILAAGRGQRTQLEEIAKQYYVLHGKTILRRSVEVFFYHPEIKKIIVTIHPDDTELAKAALADLFPYVSLIYGGETRQESAYEGLKMLKNLEFDFVHIHDAARPFITTTDLDSLHKNVDADTAAILAMPLTDTLKKSNDNAFIQETISRDRLYQAQTPQCFPFSKIFAAHEKAFQERNTQFSDDASLAEKYNLPVKLIKGSQDNFKITWPEDLLRAQRACTTLNAMDPQQETIYLPDIRVGNGYDIHAFVPGKDITLCGVKIPFEKKLNGHSDSDVAFHALTDALLATLGDSDIGTHFPPSDPQWKDASSSIFLKFASEKILKNSGHIMNIDITIIAEAPKVNLYRIEMIKTLARLLHITPSRISIKATTNEKIGALGRAEGIAALATACVIYTKTCF